MTDRRELSQLSTSHCRRQRLVVTPANSLSNLREARNHEPEAPLEESFATGKYRGSFKLRLQRNTKRRTAAANMRDGTTDDDDCETELNEEFYSVDDDEVSAAVAIVTAIVDVQQSYHDDNTTYPLSAIKENQGVESAYKQTVQAVETNAVSSHLPVEVLNVTDRQELSPPSTFHCHRQQLIVIPTNSLSNLLEVHNHEPDLPLKESFATGKYGGSFKLQIQRNTKQTAAADTSDVTTDDDDCEVEVEEESTKVDDDEASTAVTIVTTIVNVQQSHRDENTEDPLSTIGGSHGVEPVYTANMQAVTANGVSSHLTVEALHPTDEETIQSNGNPDRAQLIFLLAVLALALIVAVTVAILIPFVILVYIPVVACTGYLYFFKSVAKETDLHINPS